MGQILIGTGSSTTAEVSAMYVTGEGTAGGYEAELDFTTKSSLPSVMDTGQAITTTWSATSAAQPVISGGRFVINSTVNAAAAGYITLTNELAGEVTYMEATWEYATEGSGNSGAVALVAWRTPMPTPDLAIADQEAPCHLVADAKHWHVDVFDYPGSGTYEIHRHPYANGGYTDTTPRTLKVRIDKANDVLYITGWDGVEVPVGSGGDYGTDSRIGSFEGNHACCEIYYFNASTTAAYRRARVRNFKATSTAGGVASSIDAVPVTAVYYAPDTSTAELVWPTVQLLSLTDTFNRTNAADLGANYSHPLANYNKIVSNRADVTTTSAYNVDKRTDATFAHNNHRTTYTLGGGTTILVAPTVRANASQQVFAWMTPSQAATIFTGTGYNFASGTTSRATGATQSFTAGDLISMEAVGAFYIGRKNGVGQVVWYDSGGAYSANVNDSHRDCTVSAYSTGSGNGIDSVTWEDLGDIVLPSKMTKSGTMSWQTSATWATITTWTAANTAILGAPEWTSLVASNALYVIGNKTGATISASVPFTGSDAGRQHTIRIVRVSDSSVVATGSTVTGASGTCTASVTRNVVSGEQYRVEMNSDGASAGTITATTPFLTIS